MGPVERLERPMTREGKVTVGTTREEYGRIGVEEETSARRCLRMLIDRYPKEDIFARVPKMTERIDPVLQQLDRLLDDDEVYQQVRSDFGKRHRSTLVHGRHSTPVEVLLRMLLLKHLYGWSYQETEDRVDESLVLRWFCRLFWEPTPDDTTLIRLRQHAATRNAPPAQ